MNIYKIIILFLFIAIIIMIILGIHAYIENLFDMFSIIHFISILTVFIVLFITFLKILRNEPTRCIQCGKTPVGLITDYIWRGGPGKIYHKLCFSHLLEEFKDKINIYPGKVIFFKNDKARDQYFYLSTRDLNIYPGKISLRYSEEEIIQIVNIFESAEEYCENCKINKTKAILIEAKTIDYSVVKPLIKKKEYLKFNNYLCTNCFIDYLAEEIQLRLKTFKLFTITLPYDENGIYVWEE